MGGVDTPRAALRDRRLVGWLAFVASLATLNYVARFAAERPDERDTLYQWSSFVAGVVLFGIMLGITIVLARADFSRTLAVRRPRSWRIALLFAFLLLVGIFVLSGIVGLFLDPGEEQGLTPERWDPDRAPAFAANAVLVAGLVPVVEELTFRGLGFALLERFGLWTAIVVVGVLFGLAHGLIEALPLLVAFGIALAWLRAITGSVLPCILLHGVFNGLALLFSLVLENGSS